MKGAKSFLVSWFGVVNIMHIRHTRSSCWVFQLYSFLTPIGVYLKLSGKKNLKDRTSRRSDVLQKLVGNDGQELVFELHNPHVIAQIRLQHLCFVPGGFDPSINLGLDVPLRYGLLKACSLAGQEVKFQQGTAASCPQFACSERGVAVQLVALEKKSRGR